MLSTPALPALLTLAHSAEVSQHLLAAVAAPLTVPIRLKMSTSTLHWSCVYAEGLQKLDQGWRPSRGHDIEFVPRAGRGHMVGLRRMLYVPTANCVGRSATWHSH